MILIGTGLRVTDALRLPHDGIVLDAEGAPYLRYLYHKMKREALVPIDEQLRQAIVDQQTSSPAMLTTSTGTPGPQQSGGIGVPVPVRVEFNPGPSAKPV